MNPLHCLPVLLLLPLIPPAQGPGEGQDADPAQRFERLLRRLDKNGDQRISEEEFPGPHARFRRMDRNRDGFLSKGDLKGEAAKPELPSQPMEDAESLQFFEKRIRPVLEESCFRCHSTKGDKIRGGLLLESRALVMAGGDSGPAIVPGNPDASLLVIAMRYTDEDLEMPPKKALSNDVVRDFERWIEMGAPWTSNPEVEQPELGQHGIDIDAGREWWSFQQPQSPAVPSVEDLTWAWTDLDRFLLYAMEQQGVKPVDDAPDRSWLRRVSLDIAGLPPTAEETAAFLEDHSEQRHEKVVDRLLASPRFGERWGRHWLDVARYAESSGRDSNIVYPHAWRYRDYVIDAFDDDLPFDQFLMEQIAGDLMPAEDATQRARLDIASGYLALGSKSHNTRDPRQFATDLADEQVDTLTQGMLGVTVSCARCHDHKFDPIPTEDYYALAGIFRSSEALYGTFAATTNRHPSELLSLPVEAQVSNGSPMEPKVLQYALERRRRLQQQTSGYDGPGEGRRKRKQDMQAGEGEEDKARTRFRDRAARNLLAMTNDLFARFDEGGRPTKANRVAMGMRDAIASDMPLLIRGDIEAVGPLVPRGVPQVLSVDGIEIPEGTSGRLQVAQWVGSTSNPLTARVWTNRVWLHLFGAGLVTTPNNFGASGQPPSHPELLDWLAVSFMEEDQWSTKSLIRRITLSHAYRLSTEDDKRNLEIDPLATLLWRMPNRRLDAEVIRDSMLAAAGSLDLERPTGSIVNGVEGQPRKDRIFDYLNAPSDHRSVYLTTLRDRIPTSMEVFDAADPSFVTGDRSETNVATQALYLMNNKEVLDTADSFAERVLQAKESTKDRIELAFDLALGRLPNAAEVRAVRSFLKDYSRLPHPQDNSWDSGRSRKVRGEDERALDATREVWSAFVQTLFQCAEFRYAG